MLFTSDDELRRQQRAAARIPKGVTLSPAEQRAESMEADRELREHKRWRDFAFLLFIVPILAALLATLAGWLVATFFLPTR